MTRPFRPVASADRFVGLLGVGAGLMYWAGFGLGPLVAVVFAGACLRPFAKGLASGKPRPQPPPTSTEIQKR